MSDSSKKGRQAEGRAHPVRKQKQQEHMHVCERERERMCSHDDIKVTSLSSGLAVPEVALGLFLTHSKLSTHKGLELQVTVRMAEFNDLYNT